MKKLTFLVFVMICLCLGFGSVVFAQDTTVSFDGGSGSTLGDSTTVDSSSNSVPDVGPSGPTGYYSDAQGNNYKE